MPLTFIINENLIKEILETWRTRIAVDTNNNEFYIPDYSTSLDIPVNKVNITNNVKAYVGTFNLSMNHIYDFIGHHML